MIWVTGDTHFWHENIIEYCDRSFSSAEEMDEEMIKRWNEVVKPFDKIYHVGDFAFGKGLTVQYVDSVLARLNGRIYLCIGSHDKMTLQCKSWFEKITQNCIIQYRDKRLFISHYLHKIWPTSHYNTWHLFGHSHGRMNSYAEREGKLLDVGVDSHDFYPWSFDEIVEVMNTRPNNFNYIR